MGQAVRSRVPDDALTPLQYWHWGRCETCTEAEVSSVHQVQGQDCGMEELQ